MRVIAGKARRILLKTPEGLGTRPTTDRTKETLFNMINQALYDCDFLDLFSGSGGIGIEALSRGAHYAAFIEHEKEALNCINENLKSTRLAESAEVLALDVLSGIRALELKSKVFDIIFMDPPYNKEIEKEVLFALNASSICYCDTLIIVEASLETTFDYLTDTKFYVVKEKLYKTNKHVFIQMKK